MASWHFDDSYSIVERLYNEVTTEKWFMSKFTETQQTKCDEDLDQGRGREQRGWSRSTGHEVYVGVHVSECMCVEGVCVCCWGIASDFYRMRRGEIR
jgi:hypothetical protein